MTCPFQDICNIYVLQFLSIAFVKCLELTTFVVYIVELCTSIIPIISNNVQTRRKVLVLLTATVRFI